MVQLLPHVFCCLHTHPAALGSRNQPRWEAGQTSRGFGKVTYLYLTFFINNINVPLKG